MWVVSLAPKHPLYTNTGQHIRPTVRGARRPGRIRSVCRPPAPHPLVEKKRKTPAFCLRGHKSIVYRGSHFPLSSLDPRKIFVLHEAAEDRFSHYLRQWHEQDMESVCLGQVASRDAEALGRSLLHQDASLPRYVDLSLQLQAQFG